jgi:hypothetical protein
MGRKLSALVVLLGFPLTANAQIDYRNLDDDRPTLIEDAYPVERYAFEILASWRYTRHRGEPGGVHSFVPELEHGLFRNFHLGLKLPIAGARSATGRDWGIAGLRVFGLYNFNTEGSWLPAVALRTDAVFPVGSLAGEHTQISLKAIATRTWGRNRIHLNGAYTFGSEGLPAAADATHKWWAGGAIDRTLFRHSTLLIGEIYAVRPAASEPVELNASLGLRYQWTPVAVFDVGVTRRLKHSGPDYEVTLGVSRAFAIAGLLPGRR